MYYNTLSKTDIIYNMYTRPCTIELRLIGFGVKMWDVSRIRIYLIRGR